jgi:hypothetical protein
VSEDVRKEVEVGSNPLHCPASLATLITVLGWTDRRVCKVHHGGKITIVCVESTKKSELNRVFYRLLVYRSLSFIYVCQSSLFGLMRYLDSRHFMLLSEVPSTPLSPKNSLRGAKTKNTSTSNSSPTSRKIPTKNMIFVLGEVIFTAYQVFRIV